MYYYSLIIRVTKESQIHQIDNILNIKTYSEKEWKLEIERKDEDSPINFIDYFVSLLDGKYEQLASIGISKEDITVWMLYEYEGQCNMEFSAKEMKSLGDNGIDFCISCWKK